VHACRKVQAEERIGTIGRREVAGPAHDRAAADLGRGAGLLSLAALVALVFYFALATPFGVEQRQWSWLGPVNDWISVIGAVPWIVALIIGSLAGAAGYLTPAGSGLQTTPYVAAVVLGGPAWFGFSFWWIAVAATAN
jgi:hypothetical protein